MADTDKGKDFLVSGAPGSTVYLLVPLSPEARQWADDHIGDGGLRFGRGYAVEHRYIDDIINGIKDDGLTVVRG